MSEGPPEREVKDFKFQQLCKLRLSEALEIRTERCQWLAASHKFDLVFVAIKDGFTVLKLSDICRLDEENARERSTHIVEDAPVWARASLSNPVSHLTLSCDELTLAVAIKECGNLTLCMFDVRQFAVKTESPVAFTKSRVNASPGASLQDLAWNPMDPTLLAVCVSDGSVELVKVTTSVQRVGSLPVSCNATCFCWSPKGRQLVVGRKDGTMTQFDQEMKEKRNWPMPNILQNIHQVVDVTWISTYVFLAAYLPATADSSEQPVVILTVSSKEGPASYVNFEDVCYGSGEDRKHKYFFNYLAKWELVLLSSSNATETTVVAKHLDQAQGSGEWEHWTLEDSGRAELPLTDNQLDSFPVGVTVSFGCQTPIKLGDNKTHPPSPVMFLLSTEGLLVPYYVMYSNNKAVSLTVPQEALVLADARTASATGNTQSSAPGPTMPGFQLGAKKPELSSGSTLPTTGSSFQFVQKPAQPSPTPQGTPKVAFGGASSLPTSGNSFQFVSKPTQPPSTQTGHNLFAPVGGQAAASSGAPKTSTPVPTGLFSTPTPAAKQPATGQGQTGKSLFAVPSSGTPSSGTGFSLGSSGASSSGAGSLGFGQSSGTFSVGSGSGTGTSAFVTGTTTPGTTGTATGTTLGTGSGSAAKPSSGFSFSTTPSAPQSAASGLSGLAFGRSGSPSIFGGSSAAPTSAPAQTTKPPPSGLTAQPTAAGFGGLGQSAAGKSAFTTKVDLGKGAEPPIPTFPVSQPSSQAAGAPSTARPTSISTTRPTPHATPHTGPAGVKRDIREEPDRSTPSPDDLSRPASSYPPTPGLSEGSEKSWVNQTVESGFTKSILEDMQLFEQELRDLKARAGKGTASVGTQEEKQRLKQNTLQMSNFCENFKKSTKDQNCEVHDLKSLCLELFAMTEECRVRQERNDDPHYHQLLRSRALDPASSDTLKHLQGDYQALEQGVVEVELILDQQWEAFQDRKKAVKGRLQAPTSDTIYRAVKSNHNLVQAQKNKLEQLQEKLKNLQLYNQSSDWQNLSSSTTLNSTRSTDLTSLVNSLGQGNVPRPVRSSTMISVSPEKKAQLRDFLSQRPVPRVKSTKPSNLSMSRIIATKGLREKLDEVRSQSSPRASLRQHDPDQTVPLKLMNRPQTAHRQQGERVASPGLSTPIYGGGLGDGDGEFYKTAPLTGQTQRATSTPASFGGQGLTVEEEAESGTSYLNNVEDISPSITPDLNSDEQEGFTEEGEESYGEDEEEEEESEDEEETGFGLDKEEATGTPVTSLNTAGDKKTGIGKNLFGDTSKVPSGVGAPAVSAVAPASGGTTFTSLGGASLASGVTSGGFSFSTEAKSGLAGKPLFGSMSAQPKTTETPAAKTETINTQASSFSGFGAKNSQSESASGFKYGADAGIFSKPADSSKPATFGGFGGGSFGSQTSSVSTSEAAAVSAALNSSLLQALTDSTTVTSSSVTASATLGSSLLAALADASSPAPQEAAAALSSFSFKPGETPPSSTTASTSVESSAVTSTSTDKPAAGGSPVAGGFGQPAKFSGSPPGVTASNSTPTTTAAVFGSSGGAFGSAGPTSFGALSSSTTTTSATTSASVVKTLFGAPATATATTTVSSSSSDTATTAGTGSTTTASLFGKPATTTTKASLFGGTTTTPSLFGGAAATATGFGVATSTTTPTGSTFGSTTTASDTGFGSATTTTTTASVFGGGATTGLFASNTASASAFGSPATTKPATGFGFGQNTTSEFGKTAFGQTSAFGQNNSSFGGGSAGGFANVGAGGGSVFGGSSTSQTATTNSSTVFGQSATASQSSEGGLFGGGGGSGGGGGGLFGGLGGKPSADKANKNVFGGGTFGIAAKTENSNLFGNTGGTTSFGTATGGFGGAGTGGFTAGGTGVGSSGFGLAQTPQSPPASAGFGTAPSFGGSPSFGSSTFGGAPAFGSPSGGFGSTASFSSPVASSTFGSAGGQQAGFANFASSNSPTFGNLAQSSQPSFGGMNPGSGGGFGSAGGGGGFGSAGGFGSPAATGFGAQPAFGGQQQQSTGFGSSPQFTSYRG